MNEKFIWGAVAENMIETFVWLLNQEQFDISDVGKLFAHVCVKKNIFSRGMDSSTIIINNHVAQLIDITTKRIGANTNNRFVTNIYLIFLKLSNDNLFKPTRSLSQWDTSTKAQPNIDTLIENIQNFLNTVNKSILRIIPNDIIPEYTLLFGEPKNKENLIKNNHDSFFKEKSMNV